jgi:hypothetical protein
VLPPLPTAKSTTDTFLIARADVGQALGFVLDYSLWEGDGDFTFQGDTTYYVSGWAGYGTTTIEGGAVIKFDAGEGVGIGVFDSLVCQSGPYRPAVFTAKDDNSVGEIIEGSTGTPTNYYADTALYLSTSTESDLHDVRFSHLTKAITTFWGGDSFKFSNLQVVHCQSAFFEFAVLS